MLYTKILNAYSNFAAQSASPPLPTQPDAPALLERVRAVQHEWQQGEGINFVVKAWQQLHKQPIDASSGGSGFLTHETIEKRLREDIAAHEMADYVHHIPDKELIKVATKHFKEMQIIPTTSSIGIDPYDKNAKNTFYAMHGHGTTELFNFAVKALIKTPGDVIVTTSPTYGLFVEPIAEYKANIVSLPLTEKNNYKPSAGDLEKLISATNHDLQKNYLQSLNVTQFMIYGLLASFKVRKPENHSLIKELEVIKDYFTSNMPFASFAKIDVLISLYNVALLDYFRSNFKASEIAAWEEKFKLPLCQRVRGYFHINPHMPTGSVMDQTEVDELADALAQFQDITVIDDLTYYDLVLPPSKRQPGTFAKTKSMQQRSLTLYGPSKQFGLAAIRAGFVLGPKDIIRSIAHSVFMHANMPSVYSQNALRYVFSLPLDEKIKYLNQTRAEYALRRDLALALVQGIAHVKDKTHQREISEMLTQNKISPKQQQEILQGIPGLSITNIPESGFFLLLDMSAFKGKYIGRTLLNNSMDMQKFIYCLTDVNMVPSELNFDFSKPSLRFSFCIPPADIIEALLRIRKVLAQCQHEPLVELKTNAKSKGNTKGKAKDIIAPAKTFLPSFNQRINPLQLIPVTEPTHQHGTRLKTLFNRSSA